MCLYSADRARPYTVGRLYSAQAARYGSLENAAAAAAAIAAWSGDDDAWGLAYAIFAQAGRCTKTYRNARLGQGQAARMLQPRPRRRSTSARCAACSSGLSHAPPARSRATLTLRAGDWQPAIES
jgi:hypothetical protein